jgi:hypothetical protein
MPDDLGRDGIGALGDPGSTRHRARTLRPVVAGESAVRGRRSTSSCDSTTSATEPQAAICSSAATDSSVSASSRNSARLSTTKHGDQAITSMPALTQKANLKPPVSAVGLATPLVSKPGLASRPPPDSTTG